MNIAYLSEKSKILEDALHKHGGKELTLDKYKSWRDIFDAVYTGHVDTGVVLADDTQEGTNYKVYDLFYEYADVFAIAELNTEVEKNHYRRYFVISKKSNKSNTSNKSSMIFVVSHKPGSLYRALAIFENYELNLTKIESRRIYGRSFEYIFYVDFEYSKDHQKRMDEIFAVYKENTQYLRVIGFYKSAISK